MALQLLQCASFVAAHAISKLVEAYICWEDKCTEREVTASMAQVGDREYTDLLMSLGAYKHNLG